MARGARRKISKASGAEAPISEMKADFSHFIRQASKEEVVVTIHGRPAAVIIGFADEDDWLEYRLLKDERFLDRISQSRRQYEEGEYQTLEELP